MNQTASLKICALALLAALCVNMANLPVNAAQIDAPPSAAESSSAPADKPSADKPSNETASPVEESLPAADTASQSPLVPSSETDSATTSSSGISSPPSSPGSNSVQNASANNASSAPSDTSATPDQTTNVSSEATDASAKTADASVAGTTSTPATEIDPTVSAEMRLMATAQAYPVVAMAVEDTVGLVKGRDYSGYIVTLKTPATTSGDIRTFSATDVPTEAEMTAIPGVETCVPEKGLYSAEDLTILMESVPSSAIEAIQPNYIYYPASWTPNDTYYNMNHPAGGKYLDDVTNKPYSLTPVQWQFAAMNATSLTSGANPPAITKPDGTKVKIAVLDSGIWPGHEDIDVNTIKGFADFTAGLSPTQSTTIGSVTYKDYGGHGTAVTSYIAAKTNNGLGVASLGANADIYVAAVMGATGSTSWIRQGLQWARDQGIDVINMSFGGRQQDTVLSNAISDAIADGVIVVAAVGNDAVKADDGGSINYLSYPAAVPNVIGVGAIHPNMYRADFSHYNASVDVVAPGTMLTNPTLDSTNNYLSPATGSEVGAGTSYASPLVATLAALCKAEYPALNAGSFLQILKDTSRDQINSLTQDIYSDPAGYDEKYGWGLVDFSAAVAAAKALQNPSAGTNISIPTAAGSLTAAIVSSDSVSPTWENKALRVVVNNGTSTSQKAQLIIAEYSSSNALVNQTITPLSLAASAEQAVSHTASTGNTVKVYLLTNDGQMTLLGSSNAYAAA